MPKANFAVIKFNEHLGDKVGDLNTTLTFVGNQSTVREFDIPGTPIDSGYVVTQVADVETNNHEIRINGVNLPGVDIPPTGSRIRRDFLDVIEPDMLREGRNTIQIVRASGGDNFVVWSVVVHWLERD